MNQLDGYDIEDLVPGMSASFAKTIAEADIGLFAGASGDNNAVHINEEFARDSVFEGRIAHGMLTASVISAAIAGRLPGPGTVYLGQNLRFKAPVRPGATVREGDGQGRAPGKTTGDVDHDLPRRRQSGDRRRGTGHAYFARRTRA